LKTLPEKKLGRHVRMGIAAVMLALLAACGGNKETEQGETVAELPADEQPSSADAARFLTQATFGPTTASIDWVHRHGYPAWIKAQMDMGRNPHRAYLDAVQASLAATNGTVSQTHFRESFWAQALAGPDQLRQRATFALSEIFVISFVDGNLAGQVRGVTSYYDMLAEHAFGNYRDLLEAVSKHPMMGVYLSSLRNQKEDGKGRVADENFAREIMQLFSIGLYELNPDGTLKGGTPTETYTHEDIKGLAKVFTGWSWYAGPNLADRTDSRFFGGNANPDRDWRPMQAYNKFHSVSEKTFLGKTIPAASSADAEGDMEVALDHLFNHPNVGPFFGRLLIQRLVTSNPSPAYVGRVAAAFNNNGQGVRGDLKAVFKAILLDPEARTYDPANTTYGKLREPVLRLSSMLRAFDARSTSGRYSGLDDTDSITSSLGQTVLRSPTVFNFFRPGYTPPNSAAANAGLVAPEMQLTNEVSVAGFLNFMRDKLRPNASRDIQPDFSPLAALAGDPAALVERVNLLLMSGQMSPALRALVVAGVSGRAMPAATSSNADAVQAVKNERALIAVMLTMASPDYMIQK